jgi:DeoR/GlpR family transcriptional regulator of sugar metabolism
MSRTALRPTTRRKPRSTACCASGPERVVVAADSSKVERRAFARICAVESADTLVTDTAAGADAVRRFEEAGVRVITL